MVCERGREQRLIDIVTRWGLDVCEVGTVTDTGRFVCSWHGEVVVDVPVAALVDDAPKYERPMRAATTPPAVGEVPVPADLGATLVQLLARPSIASKRWIYRQYDHMVRTGTALRPGDGDAAVVRLPETRRGIAMSVGCNGRQCALDPRVGAALAVYEAAINVACVGARPTAITDCLNFASPERPEVMWQLSQAIDGIAEACRALDTPVVSGNVSLYNETEGRGIHPTPMIGMVGLMDDVATVRGAAFPSADLAVVLVGGAAPVLGGSEYLLLATGELAGPPPAFDAAQARATIETLLAAHADGLVLSAHDCSEGGLAVALAECCFGRDVGAAIAVVGEGRDDVMLFGEAQGRVVVATDRPDALLAVAAKHGVPAAILGRTGGDRLRVRRAERTLIDAPVAELRRGWATALEEMLR